MNGSLQLKTYFIAGMIDSLLLETCFIAGMMWSSPHQALKSVEASMQDHVIGTGLNHLVSKRHLELRSSAFEFHHRQHATLLHSSSVDARLPQPSTPYVSLNMLLVTYVCCST